MDAHGGRVRGGAGADPAGTVPDGARPTAVPRENDVAERAVRPRWHRQARAAQEGRVPLPLGPRYRAVVRDPPRSDIGGKPMCVVPDAIVRGPVLPARAAAREGGDEPKVGTPP